MLHIIASEAGEHHENGLHLAGDINEVIWGSLAFFVVFGIIVWKAGPAIRRGLEGRTARIEAELAEAKAARAEAEAALTATSADLPDLETEEARIRAEAVEAAKGLKVDLISRAQAEADEIRTRGTIEVEAFRRQAIADLTVEMSRLTKVSATDLVVGELDPTAHGDLIETYISQLEQLS
jgi:F-type H+-transporting ATPase subunit b